MNHKNITRYTILPKESYPIIRNCGGCNKKTLYKSTNCFRVNANGNRLDVWLIYQCEHCKHTYNLPIYERIRPTELNETDYKRFLSNDKALALQYGTSASVFTKYQAEIDWKSVTYDLVYQGIVSDRKDSYQIGDEILIENPYKLKLRMEKLLAEVLGVSRTKVSKLLQNKGIILSQEGIITRLTVCTDLNGTLVPVSYKSVS